MISVLGLADLVPGLPSLRVSPQGRDMIQTRPEARHGVPKSLRILRATQIDCSTQIGPRSKSRKMSKKPTFWLFCDEI